MQYFVKRGEYIQGPLNRDQLLELANNNQISGADLVGTSEQGPFQELNVVWPFIAGEPSTPAPAPQPPGFTPAIQKPSSNRTMILVSSLAGGLILIGIITAVILLNSGSGDARANLPIEEAIDGVWEMKFEQGPRGKATFRVQGDKIGITRMGGSEFMNNIVETRSNADLSEVHEKFPDGTFAGWSQSVSWIKLRDEDMEGEILMVFNESRSKAKLRVALPGRGESVDYGSMSLVKPQTEEDIVAKREAEEEIKSLEEAVRKEGLIQKDLIAIALKERRKPKDTDKISVDFGDGTKTEISFGTKDFRPGDKTEIPIAVAMPDDGVSIEVITKMRKSQDKVEEHEQRIEELREEFSISDRY